MVGDTPDKSSGWRFWLYVVSAAAACASVGFFGGCNADAADSAIRGTYADRFVLPGLISGVAIGVLVALGEQRTAARSDHERRAALRRLAYGGAWLTVGVGTLVAATYVNNDTWPWKPVDLPLRVDRRDAVRATFSTFSGGDYNVLLEYDSKAAADDVALPDVQCTVTGPPGFQEHWMPQDSGGSQLGVLRAVKGRRYTLTAQVVTPSPALQARHPHLEVMSTYMVSQHYLQAAMLYGGGVIALLISVPLLYSSLRQLRRDGRSAPH